MSSSGVGHKPDYSPVSWREYFDKMEDVSVGPEDSRDVFRVYRAGSEGPLLVLLHGGGHSALSWAVFTVSICQLTEIPQRNDRRQPQRVLTFSCVADSHRQQGDMQGARHGPQGSRWAPETPDLFRIKFQTDNHSIWLYFLKYCLLLYNTCNVFSVISERLFCISVPVLVQVPPSSANQTTSPLRRCPGDNTHRLSSL